MPYYAQLYLIKRKFQNLPNYTVFYISSTSFWIIFIYPYIVTHRQQSFYILHRKWKNFWFVLISSISCIHSRPYHRHFCRFVASYRCRSIISAVFGRYNACELSWVPLISKILAAIPVLSKPTGRSTNRGGPRGTGGADAHRIKIYSVDIGA